MVQQEMTKLEPSTAARTFDSTSVLSSVADAGWYQDPYEVHKLRYFDGDEWTGHVTHAGPVPCQHCYSHGN